METVRPRGRDSMKRLIRNMENLSQYIASHEIPRKAIQPISVKIELSEKCRKCESFKCVEKLVQMRKRKRGKKSENNC